jgi:hypothetical protein
VFGTVDSSVANTAGPDGLTFLDEIWEQAPFVDHSQFLSTVEEVAAQWEGRGALTELDRIAIVGAAERAEGNLQA